MVETSQKMGIWPLRHIWKRMGLLKTYFGVKSPFFHLKGPYLSSRNVINWLKNLFRGKKVGVTHQIKGFWPKKHLQNAEKHNFLQHYIRTNLQKVVLRLWKSFFDGIWLKECLFCDFYELFSVLQAFLGSNTHFLAGYTHFFLSEYKPQLIYQNTWKKKWTF